MNVDRSLRRVQRHLWAGDRRTVAGTVRAQREAVIRTVTLVRAFYAGGVLVAAQTVSSWDRYLAIDDVQPLWPAQWAGWVGDRRAVAIILAGTLIGAGIGALAPEWRLARAVYALCFLQYSALLNSFGKIGHGTTAWLWVSIVLVFLPDRRWRERRSIGERQHLLTVFWAAQVVVLFFYSLTGFWKVWYAVRDAAAGHANAFSAGGFSAIVAKRLSATNDTAVLADFMVRNERLGWVSYLATMYLEGASVLVAFRPHLHRLWGLGLISFHLMTHLVMHISFPIAILLVGIILVSSPFAPDRLDVRRVVGDLPGIFLVRRTLARRRRRRRRAPVAAPAAS